MLPSAEVGNIKDFIYDACRNDYRIVVGALAWVVTESLKSLLQAFKAQHHSKLPPNARTVLGSIIETNLCIMFGLSRPTSQVKGFDVEIVGNKVGIKVTIHDNWMIRKNAIGNQLFLFQVDLDECLYSCGVMDLTNRDQLNGQNSDKPDGKEGNGDSKLGLSERGRAQISYIVEEGPFEYIVPEYEDFGGIVGYISRSNIQLF